MNQRPPWNRPPPENGPPWNRQTPGNGAEQPRAEPEIIPPDKSGRDRHGSDRRGFRRAEMHIVFGEPGFRRITIARPGLFAIVMAALAIGAVATALLVFLLGTLLVALPVIGAAIVIAFVMALIRGPARLH